MGNKTVPVLDNPNLVRDIHSSAILNVDNEGLKAYKLKKKNVLNNQQRLDRLEEKMDMLLKLLEEKL